MIGSDDITLEIQLENQAEPAYLTSIVFIFPKGIMLRSILPFCVEDRDRDDILMISEMIVICNISNPLGMNEQVSTIKIERSSCRLFRINACQDYKERRY